MNFLKRIFHVGPTVENPSVRLYNTLGREEQEFRATKSVVKMYNCGPTVYDRQHIGNLSAAVFADTIRRMLEYNGLSVKQVVNITDFGHLSGDNEGDADTGEDRITKGMKRDKVALSMENMREFTSRFMNQYLADIRALNVAVEKITFPRASDYVPSMIAMIRSLEEKGYAYKIQDGVYFDTSRFPAYGALGGISEGQEAGARVEMSSEKRSKHDFALWKSASSRSKLGWDSPWGRGFPGWHLECSAMIHSILGDQIDIHTGGIEHIAIHHNNEIAQSEAATGKRPMSRFWLHREHIRMQNAKLAKSTGNTAYLSDVSARGIHPLALRYWFLTAHYRQPANFTWEALEAAQKAFLRLHEKFREVLGSSSEQPPSKYLQKFHQSINSDLDTPGAIASIWESLNSGKLSAGETKAMLLEADSVFALGLTKSDHELEKLLTHAEALSEDMLPDDVRELYRAREEARSNKDWAQADRLRDALRDAGYTVEDGRDGAKILRQ